MPDDMNVLHPQVAEQIKRLMGRLPNSFTPRDDWTVLTQAGKRRVPGCIQAILAIEWPEEHFLLEGDELDQEMEFPTGSTPDPDWPCGGERRAWLSIGMTSTFFYWMVDLDETGSGDPPVYVFDHDGSDEEVPEADPLSQMLAELDVVPPPSEEDRLPRACAIGDTATVRALLNTGAGLGPVDETGLTPLHLAVIGRSPETVRVLLDAGADPRAAIMESCDMPLRYRNPRVHSTGSRMLAAGDTPLHLAVAPYPRANSGPEIDRESVEALVVKGADPNAADDNGATPLHYAVIADEPDALESVRLLLWAGADPGAPLDSPSELKYGLVSRTPLAIARELGNTLGLALLEDADHKA